MRIMGEDDIRGIYWLLKEINEDRKLASYFREQLNIRNTDIKRLMIIFTDFIKILDNPMKDELSIDMIPNIRVGKL